MTQFDQIVLGGKYAYKFRYGVYALPALVFGTAVSENDVNVNYGFWKWSASALVSVLITFVAFVIIDQTIFKNRVSAPKPNSWVFVLGFFLGLIKGFTTGILAEHLFGLGPFSAENLILRTVSAGLIGFLGLPILALANYSWDNLHHVRRSLLADLQGIDELTNLTKEGNKKSQELTYLETVQKRVENIRNQFERKINANIFQTGDQIAGELRNIANEIVRPLSHEAANRASRTLSARIKFNQLILLLPETITIGLPWLLAINAVTGRLHIETFGIRVGILTLLLDTATLFVALHLVHFLLRKIGTNQVSAIAIPILVLFIRSKMLFFFLDKIHTSHSAVPFLPNAIWSVFLFFLVSFSSTYLVLQLRNLNRLETEYSQKYIEMLRRDQTEHLLSSRLARYLHGTVQTRLIASALRMKGANEVGAEVDVRRELENVLNHLTIPDLLLSESPSLGFMPNLERIIEQWDGLLTIKYKISGEIDFLSQIFVTQVCELINEAFSNSLRHGEADEIELSVVVDKHIMTISITDNGKNDLKKGFGLGSAHFTRIASQGWELYRDSEKAHTILTARIGIPG